MQDRTIYRVYDRWRADLGMSPEECRYAYSVLLEQVFWSLLQFSQARLPHLGLVTVQEDASSGVRFRAGRWLKDARRQALFGHGKDDRAWVEDSLRPMRRHAAKGRKKEESGDA